MREIVNKLHENRQLEKAKSIMESNGYKVSKKSKGRRLNESTNNDSIYSFVDEYEELDYWDEIREEDPEGVEFIESNLGCRVEDCYVASNESDNYEVAEKLDAIAVKSKSLKKDVQGRSGGYELMISPAGEKFVHQWGSGSSFYYIPKSGIKESKESKEDIKESNLNESALDQLWDLYDSSPAIADAIEKIADELGIGTDNSPTEEEAKQILDAYRGEGNDTEVRSAEDIIEDIIEVVEDLPFVVEAKTFKQAMLMTNNKGFVITANDGKKYQFSLLGSF